MARTTRIKLGWRYSAIIPWVIPPGFFPIPDNNKKRKRGELIDKQQKSASGSLRKLSCGKDS